MTTFKVSELKYIARIQLKLFYPLYLYDLVNLVDLVCLGLMHYLVYAMINSHSM